MKPKGLSDQQKKQWEASFRRKFGKDPSHQLQSLLKEVKKQDEDFRLGRFSRDELYYALGEVMNDLQHWRHMTKQLNRGRFVSDQ